MADIFREVDEALREDRVKAIWARYGRLIIAVAVLIVLASAAWVVWRNWTQAAEAEGAAAIEMARGSGDPAALAAAVEAAGNADQAALARFYLAAEAAESGDRAAAVSTYRTIATDGSVSGVFRDLARLLAVLHEVDSGDPGQLAAEIEPLAADGAPWRFSAREVQGLLALRRGDEAAARAIFTALAESVEAPPGVRDRAYEVLGGLGEQE